MLNKDIENLKDILESSKKVREYTKKFTTPDDFFQDTVYFDATLMNFVNIGESIIRLTDVIQQKYPDVDWQKIKGLRNIIAHDYFGVDAEEIWQIAVKKIPELETKIEEIIKYEEKA